MIEYTPDNHLQFNNIDIINISSRARTVTVKIGESSIIPIPIPLEDLASSICSDDQKIKGQLMIILIQCHPQIKRISFLFGCEHLSKYLITALKSVVCCLEYDELCSMISFLMLPMLPLQVACAKSLPVPQTSLCQVREQKHIQAKDQ